MNRRTVFGALAVLLVAASVVATAAVTLPAMLRTQAGAATFALTAATVALVVLAGVRGYGRRTPYW
jgi:hypothetical protein